MEPGLAAMVGNEKDHRCQLQLPPDAHECGRPAVARMIGTCPAGHIEVTLLCRSCLDEILADGMDCTDCTPWQEATIVAVEPL
jgi:hypothetical protein